MSIIWSPSSLEDLGHIEAYFSEDNPTAAAHVVQSIFQFATEQLKLRTGRHGRVADTFELVIPKLPYIVVYQLTTDDVQILRIYHTSRKWPGSF